MAGSCHLIWAVDDWSDTSFDVSSAVLWKCHPVTLAPIYPYWESISGHGPKCVVLLGLLHHEETNTAVASVLVLA